MTNQPRNVHVFPPELSFYAEHVLAQMDKGRYQKKRDYMERKIPKIMSEMMNLVSGFCDKSTKKS